MHRRLSSVPLPAARREARGAGRQPLQLPGEQTPKLRTPPHDSCAAPNLNRLKFRHRFNENDIFLKKYARTSNYGISQTFLILNTCCPREARARCWEWVRKSKPPTRPDTARHGPTRPPSSGPVKSTPTPYLKREHFRRKMEKSRPTSYLKPEHFRRKMAKSRPTSYLKREHLRRKIAKLRPTSYLKRKHFRRKTMKSRTHFLFGKGAFWTKNCGIDAHYFSEKGALSTKNSETEAHFLFRKIAFSTEIS